MKKVVACNIRTYVNFVYFAIKFNGAEFLLKKKKKLNITNPFCRILGREQNFRDNKI